MFSLTKRRAASALFVVTLACIAKADLLEVEVDPPDIRIMGEGRLAGRFRSTVGEFVATGDINGDGLLDIATNGLLHLEPTVTVFLGRASWPSVWDLRSMPPDCVIQEVPIFRPDSSCFGIPLGDTDDGFATNIACGDLTGDGIDDILVGGPCWGSRGGFGRGMVIVVPGRPTWPARIDVDPSTWAPAVIGPDVVGGFGRSLAAADVDGDGHSDLVVGAPRTPGPTGTEESGALYVVGGPLAPARVAVEDVGASLYDDERAVHVGNHVSIGHATPDLKQAIVVPEPLYGGAGAPPLDIGRVFVLDGSRLDAASDLDESSARVVVLEGNTTEHEFGSVARLADIDCSGWGEIVVLSRGAHRPDGRPERDGRLDMYRDAGRVGAPAEPSLTVWGRKNWLTTAGGANFMMDAACTGDLDADGFDEIIIGQRRSDGPSGAVLEQGDVTVIWNRPDMPPVLDLEEESEWKLTIAGRTDGYMYGLQVNVADVNNDGRLDLLASSAYPEIDGMNASDGGIDVFTRNLHVTTVHPNAGADQVVDIVDGATGCSTDVVLDASASVDDGGNALRHRWYEGADLLAEGERVTVSLGPGEHCIRLYSTSAGGWANAKVHVVVRDQVSPEIRSITVDPPSLWPPNHRMRPIHVTVDAWDACTPATELAVTLVDVSSNEPMDRRGDGHTALDFSGFDLGTSDFDGELRAERSGRGAGREYTLTYEVRDAAGNAATASVVVPVAHDRRGSPGRPARRTR